MTQKKILIVEDEAIIAKNIERGLKNLGYGISAIVRSGEKAIEQAATPTPDLVLMDIQLDGAMNGIEAAKEIQRRHGIPVIYLTAFADEATLQQAKDAQPFGYLVKPFEIKELHSTIEMALYRHEMEHKLRESEERYRSFVQNFQGIAFRATLELVPTFFHGAVEQITGYTEQEFIAGQPTWEQVIHPEDLHTIAESARRIGVIPNYSTEREYRILRKDGEIRWIHEFIQTICDLHGQPAGVQGALYDITARKQAEEERERLIAELQTTLAQVRTLRGLLPICSSCKKIRDDRGYWTQVEVYVRDHSEAEFSHSVCPECTQKLYPDYFSAKK